MLRIFILTFLLPLAALPAAASSQPAAIRGASDTRLDIVATGEVNRVPNVASITAGVVTRAATASQAIAENAQRMQRVVGALGRAGVAGRDIQTNYFTLNQEFGRVRGETPVPAGYNASNQVIVRFRDIARSGRILDALVAEGSNQISGPSLTVDRPDAALDEARLDAIAKARARAQLYATAIGKRVGRIISISESGAGFSPPQPVTYGESRQMAETTIVPGEQTISVTLAVSFELE
jgi:uncharacterized protein YggE